MRRFSYVEPTIVTVTEEDIIRDYYPYWEMKMKHVGKEDLISKENCIEDWKTVNWAKEIE